MAGQSDTVADNPVYMENKYKFFRDNADAIAYETYFNGDATSGGHKPCPSSVYPKAAAVYQNDWGLEPVMDQALIHHLRSALESAQSCHA